MKKFMILGASVLQLPAIRQAKEMGLHVVAVDMDPNAVGFLEEGITKEVISTIDVPAVVAAAKKHGVCGIITVASDMPMRSVAAVAKEMGLVGISDETAIKATNKADMRMAFKEHGVAIPAFFKVSNEEEYAHAVSCLEDRFIVKPADNSGSRGIFLVEDKNDAQAVKAAYEYSRKYSRNGDVMVEEFMVGPEVSVELLAVKGVCHVLQITDKITTGAPHFVEIGHSQPSRLPPETREAIKELAIAAAKAVGIENGPGHAEIIVTRDGPKMVEIGARMGGGCITTHLVPLSTGIDMTGATIKTALGELPDIEPKIEMASAIRFILPKVGRIAEIDGVEEARAVPGIVEVTVQCSVGQVTGALESGANRLGYVIAQAKDPARALEICSEALSRIVIRME